MAYPADVQIPLTWEIRPEDVTYYGGEQATVWHVSAEGRERGGHVYPSRAAAEQYAQRLAELDAVNTVVEQEIGQERHYGIRVWSEPEPGRDAPRWLITDPHRGHEGFAFAWFSETPPPVEVYTREQYERACAALDIEPAADTGLDTYGDKYGSYDLITYTPRQVITMTLRARRIGGLKREHAARVAESRRELEAAGLAGDSYTREEYEQASAIMQVPALSDSACIYVVEEHLSGLSAGSHIIVPGIPVSDEVVRELCYRRITAMERDESEPCDECGMPILPGKAMYASLGRACSVEHFDAMADRPGRYATRSAR